MNMPLPKDPFYKGLAYILVGVMLLFYVLGFFYSVMNMLFAVAAIGLIVKGLMIAGFDKPIMALYNKIMKKH